MKILSANIFLAVNSALQWMSDVDMALKLLGTLIALPVAYYTAKSFYWKARLNRANALKVESEAINKK